MKHKRDILINFAPMEKKKLTNLNEIGEFGLIDRLTKSFENSNGTTVKGVGDDAAVLYRDEATFSLVSTDMLIEGVHFDLIYTPLKHLGYKAVVVNLSDICAMNGTPEQIVVSLAISSKYTAEAMDELYEGMYLACKQYSVDLVGGDTTSSLAGLCISITAIGVVDKEKITYRSGAKENDLLVVTGDLGGAYVGLQALNREKDVFLSNPEMQPELEGLEYLVERQLKPEARKDVIGFLYELGVIPTSMIDVSDGLASEILHLARASKLGCHLYEDKMPIDPVTYQTAVDFNLDPTMCALNGGEDYELLFTVKQEDYDRIKGSPHFTVIGYMTDYSAGTYLVTKSDTLIPLVAQGWNHFERGEN
jgi:thiamine-monophosphate kinase